MPYIFSKDTAFRGNSYRRGDAVPDDLSAHKLRILLKARVIKETFGGGVPNTQPQGDDGSGGGFMDRVKDAVGIGSGTESQEAPQPNQPQEEAPQENQQPAAETQPQENQQPAAQPAEESPPPTGESEATPSPQDKKPQKSEGAPF